MTSPETRSAPWWTGGHERCPRCLQAYVYEMEVRCVACDEPSCPHCVVWVRETRRVYCPECAPAGDDGERPAAAGPGTPDDASGSDSDPRAGPGTPDDASGPGREG